MKYSLRSLMIAVTLAAVLLAICTGRVRYLQQMAEHHRRAALENFPWFGSVQIDYSEKIEVYWYHRAVAERFRAGLRRPWQCVDDRSPPAEDEREIDPLDPFWETP